MARILISSNPYLRQVSFSTWKDGWQPINAANNPNGNLIKKEYAHGFFPFKAYDIVQTIIHEYQCDDDKIELIFEGSDDEFNELQDICGLDDMRGSILLYRFDRTLANARDILPNIASIFQELRPVIDTTNCTDEVRSNIKKFFEVASDLVPICVMGNYSAGKSTFINALIGCELLPSGDQPITAKIYQISQSHQQNCGVIRLTINESEVSLHFNESGFVQENDHNNPLYDTICEATSRATQNNLIAHMNAALEAINDMASSEQFTMGDLIKVETPFCRNDPWSQSGRFVIFDTPGSNSASSSDHLRVLREAMRGFSNGLPVYVTEHSTLDSTDNAKLYDEIRTIEAMDERFAMVVVNKADSANLPKEGFSQNDISKILHSAVARNLYSYGIFFMSSIIALGSKNGGDFLNDFYAEMYEDQVRKFEDPSSRFYKTLYQYNILPRQIKDRAVRNSEHAEQLILANSGLLCLEDEIELFAIRHSAYNKCLQAKQLMQSIVDTTIEETERVKRRREESRERRTNDLERDKAALVQTLKSTGEAESEQANQSLASYLEQGLKPEEWFTDVDALNETSQAITTAKRELLDYEKHQDEAGDAFESIIGNFTKRVSHLLKEPNLDALYNIAQGIADDTANAFSKGQLFLDTSKNADIATSDELLSITREQYRQTFSAMVGALDRQSQGYWSERAEKARNAIYGIATESSALSAEERMSLGKVIIGFPPLALSDDVDRIFNKDRLKLDFRLWDFVIIGSDKLNLKKVTQSYNNGIAQGFDKARDAFSDIHAQSYQAWLANLLIAVENDITDFSPTLHNYVETIQDDTDMINELERKLRLLRDGMANVSRLIDWREQGDCCGD